MAANTTEQINALNVKVMMHFKGELGKDDLDSLKEIIKGLRDITPHNLEKCTTFEKLWNALGHKVLIKDGDYSYLKTLFEKMDRPDLANQVDEYQEESRRILSPSKKYGSENIGHPTTSGCQPSDGAYHSTQRHDVECYKMSSNPRGLCIIINNVNFHQAAGGKQLDTRVGSDVDADAIARLFKTLKFEIKYYGDHSSSMIMDVVKDMSRGDHTHYDCLVFFILSHGSENGVFGADGIEVKIQDIYISFAGDRCLTLREKPKLFFIQTCRGESRQESFPTDGQVQMDGNSLPALSDFLFGYATAPGLVSYRNTSTGSWYITTFLKILERDCDSDDLVSILTKVNDEVARLGKGSKQIPMPQFSLRKKVFLKSH